MFMFAIFANEQKSSVKKDTKASTIVKCLKDITDKSPIVRKKAAMIIGKYNTTETNNALVKALSDDDENVRNAALVSTMEKRITPRNAGEPIFLLLNDSNVHTRRLASSSLPRLIGSFYSLQRSKSFNKIIIALTKAFADKDIIVRTNMINYSNFFLGIMPDKIFDSALKDSDDDIRIIALQKIIKARKINILLNNIVTLSKDKKPLIRKNLLVGLKGVRSTNKIKSVINNLLKDNNFDVSTEALILALKNHYSPDLQTIESRLFSPQLSQKKGLEIIGAIGINQDTLPLYKKLLSYEREEYKAVAIQKLSYSKFSYILNEKVLKFLKEESYSIREIAGRVLLKNPQIIEFKTMLEFIESPYYDVRYLLISLSKNLNKENAEELLMELICDDNEKVRAGTISEIYRRKVTDWEDILIQSLEEESFIICQVSVYTLLNNLKSKKIMKALIEFTKKETKNKSIQLLIARIKLRIKTIQQQK